MTLDKKVKLVATCLPNILYSIGGIKNQPKKRIIEHKNASGGIIRLARET